ncbi:MAG: hypothetical protein IPJ59_18080 [Nannocystis sp.]|nr:hypothetical protein [Nannocystis sp.]
MVARGLHQGLQHRRRRHLWSAARIVSRRRHPRRRRNQEDSAAIGVGGDQDDEGALSSGAVYVYTRANLAWSQRAYVKATNGEVGDFFGAGIGLSSDGATLAVGAYAEDSPATGIGGNQSSNAAASAGAVYLY